MSLESYDFDSFGVELRGRVPKRYEVVLNPNSLALLVLLHNKFEEDRQQLLQERVQIYQKIQSGHKPGFLPQTRNIREGMSTVLCTHHYRRGSRPVVVFKIVVSSVFGSLVFTPEGDWKVDPVKGENSIMDRTVDVVCWRVFDEKFISECVQSGANGIQFDYDDSFAPSWYNCLESQLQLFNFVLHQNSNPTQKFPDMLVRPRSLNLDEAHIFIGGKVLSGSLFDFAVWVTTWYTHTKNKNGCYFYIPKLENHKEALWWDEVFSFTEEYFNLPSGYFKALVLIENILAVFEMHEILYSMRRHCLGLNTGKWDYIFSYIKKFRHDPAFVLPDRSSLTIDQTFLGAYEALLIQTCKKRGCVATGGMAPNLHKNTEEDKVTYQKILETKARGARVGLNGELVADPVFVGAVRDAFSTQLSVAPAFNLANTEEGLLEQLLAAPTGKITAEGIKYNVKVVLNYIESWMLGEGGCPLEGAVEDLATAEISRSELWQWIKHCSKTSEGKIVTFEFVSSLVSELVKSIEAQLGESFSQRHFLFAQEKLLAMLEVSEFLDFMPALLYPHLIETSELKL